MAPSRPWTVSVTPDPIGSERLPFLLVNPWKSAESGVPRAVLSAFFLNSAISGNSSVIPVGRSTMDIHRHAMSRFSPRRSSSRPCSPSSGWCSSRCAIPFVDLALEVCICWSCPGSIYTLGNLASKFCWCPRLTFLTINFSSNLFCRCLRRALIVLSWNFWKAKVWNFFLQHRSHLQAKKLGEDGVGEGHLIWIQASPIKELMVKVVQNWADYFFAANLEAHPTKKAKMKSEGTRNVPGCNVAKSKTQQMCRSQGINGQLVELEQSHGSSLEPLDKHFHRLIYETRKVSKLENKICHDLNPRRCMDGSMRPNDPCRLREKITNRASCAGTKPRGTVNLDLWPMAATFLEDKRWWYTCYG